MRDVDGKFGHKVSTRFPCTFGMNAKGGMDDLEFEQYCMNSIVPLYPDARGVKGLRVMIKADSGLGRQTQLYLQNCNI